MKRLPRIVHCAGFMLALGCRERSDRPDPPALAKPTTAIQAGGAPRREQPEPVDLGPLVDLSGRSNPSSVAVVAPGKKRVYSRALRTWVRERPDRDSKRLGYLRSGASSPTTDEPASRAGCPGGWYPVVPRGYVCVGRRATLDPQDPVVAATLEHPPDHMRKMPYIYGTVRNPGPVYARLPSKEELHRAEPDIDERMPRWLEAPGEIGASYAQDVWLGYPGQPPDPAEAWRSGRTSLVPEYLKAGGQAPNIHRRPREPGQLVIGQMGPRVGYAFLSTFFWQGRRYGVTTELEVLPTDRLRPIQGSDFHGFEIGKDVEFPFALVRRPSAHYWIYQRSTDRLIDAGSAPYRAAVALTGKQQFFGGVLHYETADGKYLSDRDASRLDPARNMPGWGTRGEKWIDVNLTKQTMMLYEGTRPVYATLISSGEAGLEDPDRTTATKRGIFRIHTKHVTTTMSSHELGEEFELRDVPYVQYFDGEGYAIHGAYWHDRFGIPKSHGCINLAPEDARRIFHWTEPRVPRGWHGALLPLRGTVVFIHR